MCNDYNKFMKAILYKPSLQNLDDFQVRFIIAMRVSTLAKERKIDAGNYLQKYLGGKEVARYFSQMMETINESWPENINTHTPCTDNISYDEMLILDLIKSVSSGQIMYFHGMLCEMLSKSSCERLHHNIMRLIQSIQHKKAYL